ncbi:hypothetical protein L218DRAFT_869524 [Marasmius fiardii PR-910]|nr:hypothetical protein L218DRAFT_869524 [Marasmius fiardii PR-910]
MSESKEKAAPLVQKSVDADEDLDELDDVLAEFNPPPVTSLPQKPSFGRKRTNTRVDQPPVSIPGDPPTETTNQVDEALLSDEFAKELAKNMEELMKELVSTGEKEESRDRNEDQDKNTERVLKAAWEAMLIEGMNGMTGGGGENVEDKAKGGTGGFQSRIKQTMDKLKESEDNLKVSFVSVAGSSSAAPDTLEGLLKSLQDLGLDNEDDSEFNGFLENVMNELMSKDVLHQPLKELYENFPPYLENPPEPITSEDRKRYEAQLVAIKKIIAIFDKPGYDDKDPVASKEIVDLMGELQSHGSPPEAVMGPLPPGMGVGPDGSPEGCVIG